MTISRSINAIASCFCGSTTADSDASSTPIASASNAFPSYDGRPSARARPNPRGVVHPAIQQYVSTESTKKALSDLPQELTMNIARFADTASLMNLRSVNKNLNLIASDAIKHVFVRSSADLKAATRVYGPGGIDEIALIGRNVTNADLKSLPRNLIRLELRSCRQFTDADLADLPQTLQHLDLEWCSRLTNEALGHLINMPLKVLKVNHCHLITDIALTDLKKDIGSLKTIEHRCHEIVHVPNIENGLHEILITTGM